MLIDYLEENYERTTPIFVSDIQYQNRSRSWLYKQLALLCAQGKLCKFDKGVYYLPEMNRLGLNRILSSYAVAEKKYIGEEENTIGYYSGITLLNSLGLTTQMAGTVTICTNKQKTRKRIVDVGNARIILRKPRTTVDSYNVNTMRLLDVVTDLPEYELSKDDNVKRIISFMKIQSIKSEDIKNMVGFYPDVTSKKLIQSGLIFMIK